MEHGDLAFTRHGLVLCDVFCNLGIQLGELAFDQGQTCLGLAFQDGVDLNLTAVAQARALLDQRCSRNLQLAKTLEFLRDRRIWFQSQRRQQGRCASDPVAERGAMQIDPLARVDPGLPLQRQTIAIIADQHVRHEAGTGAAAFDQARG